MSIVASAGELDMTKISSLRRVIVPMLLFSCSGAFAVECNDVSPYFQLEGDAYYDIEEVEPITDKERRQISKLISYFENKNLIGTGSYFECIGPEKSPRQKISTTELTADLTQYSDGKLAIQIESFNAEINLGEREKLEFFDANSPHEIIELTEKSLVIRTKLRQSSIFNEEITQFSRKGRRLTITTTRYLGTVFGFQHTRELRF